VTRTENVSELGGRFIYTNMPRDTSYIIVQQAPERQCLQVIEIIMLM
jgi:hypothetical protein